LPGRNEREAFNQYADPLKEVLGCITNVQLRTEGSFKASAAAPSQFVFIQNPARLSNSALYLFFRQSFHLIYREEQEDWKVKTDSYEYAIENSEGRELLAYHWDPAGRLELPHLHFGAIVLGAESPITRKTHVPSGRVPLEDVVWFVIEELGVEPLRADWNKLTAFARKRFMEHKSW
jgi:hypothetical protein